VFQDIAFEMVQRGETWQLYPSCLVQKRKFEYGNFTIKDFLWVI
jgi:hypothetical protein